eukprot:3129239-Rhodomonas_salina.1
MVRARSRRLRREDALAAAASEGPTAAPAAGKSRASGASGAGPASVASGARSQGVASAEPRTTCRCDHCDRPVYVEPGSGR